jgi:hypothetical protein
MKVNIHINQTVNIINNKTGFIEREKKRLEFLRINKININKLAKTS